MMNTASIHTYTFDINSRLTVCAVSDGRTYTYTWSNRGQMLAEYTQGYSVHAFAYNDLGAWLVISVDG